MWKWEVGRKGGRGGAHSLTWLMRGGLTGTMPDGVSARMWKWEVGGGPIGVGRLSASTW